MSRLLRSAPARSFTFSRAWDFGRSIKKGSHKFFRHPDGRTATVPDHKGEDLGRGILAKILRDAGAKTAEFLAWLS